MGAFLMPQTIPTRERHIMTDDGTPTTTDPGTPDPGTPDTGAQSDTDEVSKWKALSRKHEATAKANAAAAAKLAAIEESQKTEAQKAADKATELEQRATAAELKALRYEVGVEKGIPANLLRYLTGATKEELEANAAQLIADFGTGTDLGTGTPPSSRPREALRAGASAETTPDPTSAINDRIRLAARGR